MVKMPVITEKYVKLHFATKVLESWYVLNLRLLATMRKYCWENVFDSSMYNFLEICLKSHLSFTRCLCLSITTFI
jgi:hypothetical protein